MIKAFTNPRHSVIIGLVFVYKEQLMKNNVLAYDFGASSGRAMLGTLEDGKISIKEIHRFSNDPVTVGKEYYWDVLRLWHEIKNGLVKAKEFEAYESIGIDTWGVSFGVIDKDGSLVANPMHYRDTAFDKAREEFLKEFPFDRLYELTGIQDIAFNTVYQLYNMKKNKGYILDNAGKILLISDIFNYFLSGEKSADFSMASTTALMNVNTHEWDREIFEFLGIDRALMCDIKMPGTVIGNISDAVCEELMIKPAKVVSVAAHDTASAVIAVPSNKKNIAYISCGTWSLLGTELDRPNTSADAMRANFTNEGGYNGSVRFLKNIMGLWLIQESRRHWMRTGKEYSFAELEKLACECTPFESIIDVDDQRFSPPGDIPGRVQQFCRETGQKVPQTVGEIMQCIYCSLALKYRDAFKNMEKICGVDFETIHMVGGGIKDTLLCRLTAGACGIPVTAGPVEATVIGNIAAQLMALGHIESIEQARDIIARSFPIKTYAPENEEQFKAAFEKYKNIRITTKN